MNQFFSDGMSSEYANHKDSVRHSNSGRAGRRQGSLGSFLSTAADAVDEQQENRFHSSRSSKASSAYRLSSHKADKFGAASLGGYGASSGGTKKYGAELLPDIYDEVFRLPAKLSSSSKYSDLPVLDPTAYYDEEDLFSSSTVMRNNSAVGVIYEDVFGGGLATGPTYTDLNDLLECFGASNSRSGEASSSSSGLHAQSPSAMTSSVKHEPDEDELFQSSKPESTGKRPKPLQSRSVNAFWQKDVEEEPYTRLIREHAGCQNKRGSRSFKNGETQKERKGEVIRQAFEPSFSVQKLSPLSTDTDPASVVQSSCSKDFSGLTSCGTNSSSHNYTRDWLRSIDNYSNSSESIKFLNHDMEASLSPNWKEEMCFEDHLSLLENFEPIKSVTSNGAQAQKERHRGEVWLTVDDLKLKTGPSVTPPPSRLPPLPRGAKNANPLRMPDRHAQGNGHAHLKVHANGVGQKSQDSTASTGSDFELNFSVPSAHNEAAGDGMTSSKEAEVSTGDNAILDAEESDSNSILTPLKSDIFNNKLQVEAGEIVIGAAKKDDREEQVKVSDNKDQEPEKQQEENVMNFTGADHMHGLNQKERKTITFKNIEQKEEQMMMRATVVEHRHEEQKERKTVLVDKAEHKEEEMMINSKVTEHVHETEQKERKTISVENVEHNGEEAVIAGVLGTIGVKKDANWNVEVMNNKDNEEVIANDMQNEDREVESKPEPEIMGNPTAGMRQNEEENNRNRPSILEARDRVAQSNLNAEDLEPVDKADKEIKGTVECRKAKVLNDVPLESWEKKDWGFREIEIDIQRREREYELERQKEREMEREKDRMGLENTFFEQKVKLGRTPTEMATAASRERVTTDRIEKGGAEKIAVPRFRTGFAAAERFHADMSERVSERAFRPPDDIQGSDEKSRDQRNLASGSQQRTLERVAKALAEKKQRDLEAQWESAEKERIAGSLDLEIKRWSSGKEGNLRALLSTLQYECGWQTISLTDIISSAAVKRAYRKATLCVHPDKVQQKGATVRQKYIAEKVFDLLKEAWNKFNIDEQK
ncbi:hypothetical protein O6H91_05G066100 [Diphasiastrum complanatum]|uniref:Uncharacterized protein n=1 Tax=Diphasiastrum complanatum TaxID=34168 RepID=A0ACC2DPF2_DIPCM|nr:hypothetical protein O6H91_05G066100 [Diphasiastrum complanatum]